MTLGAFLIIHLGTSTISNLTAELIAGIASLVAVVIVTTMILWMSKASVHISSDLKSGMTDALVRGGPAVMGLAFLAVGREGFETALLMVGYAESVSGGLWPTDRAGPRVLIAIALTVLIYRGAIHLDFHKFFLHRAFPHPGRRGNPVVRGAGPANLWMAARDRFDGVRFLRTLRPVLVVFWNTSGRNLQLPARSHHVTGDRVVGVSGRGARIVRASQSTPSGQARTRGQHLPDSDPRHKPRPHPVPVSERNPW